MVGKAVTALVLGGLPGAGRLIAAGRFVIVQISTLIDSRFKGTARGAGTGIGVVIKGTTATSGLGTVVGGLAIEDDDT